MPTTHVEPSSGELLQDIANSLLKARKVVVVTGAGISTNSGIPVRERDSCSVPLCRAAREPFTNNAAIDRTFDLKMDYTR